MNITNIGKVQNVTEDEEDIYNKIIILLLVMVLERRGAVLTRENIDSALEEDYKRKTMKMVIINKLLAIFSGTYFMHNIWLC